MDYKNIHGAGSIGVDSRWQPSSPRTARRAISSTRCTGRGSGSWDAIRREMALLGGEFVQEGES